MRDEMFSLHGRTALITGGARGIGRTVAEALGRAGADLLLFDLDQDSLDTTAAALRERTGREVTVRVVDVTDHDAVRRALDAAWEQLGPLQLLFNNAGIVLQKPAIETTAEEWRRVIDVNLHGVFHVAQLFGKKLVENGIGGAIVNTGSMSGTIVNQPQLQASYNASKAGVVHLTKSLAVEWAEHGIRVNCLSPGYIATDLTATVRKDWQEQWAAQTPMRRLGRPEELASSVVYLLADSSSFTTGAELVVDGGFTLI